MVMIRTDAGVGENNHGVDIVKPLDTESALFRIPVLEDGLNVASLNPVRMSESASGSKRSEAQGRHILWRKVGEMKNARDSCRDLRLRSRRRGKNRAVGERDGHFEEGVESLDVRGVGVKMRFGTGFSLCQS
jgi:hypothetical protein